MALERSQLGSNGSPESISRGEAANRPDTTEEEKLLCYHS
jgi:hypothetical protein